MSSFCGNAENQEGVRNGRMSQWARGHTITWHVASAPPGFSVGDLSDIAATAWEVWAKVCGVKSSRSTQGFANVLIGTDNIDGGRGILAQAELPPPGMTSGQLRMWFDRAEAFVLAKNPPSGKIDILRVAIHELGHIIGMGHAPAGSRNLMAPAISDIREPMPDYDIPQSVARYGEAGVVRPPQPPTGGDGELLELLRILREIRDACPDNVKAAIEEWNRG